MMMRNMEVQEVKDEEYLNSFPVGYRFFPKDEELVTHYLKNKVLKLSLPINRIRDVNIYQFDPQQLSEMYKVPGEKNMYFFTPRDRKYPNGNRPNRAAGYGFWKATGADTTLGDEKGKPIGFKKALVYYQGKPKAATKTNWIMHEYRINQKSSPKNATSSMANAAPIDMKLDDWVLCKIYKKANKSENKQKNGGEAVAVDSIPNKTPMPLPTMQTANFGPVMPLRMQAADSGSDIMSTTDSGSVASPAPEMQIAADQYSSLMKHEMPNAPLPTSGYMFSYEHEDPYSNLLFPMMDYPELQGPLYQL